MKTSNLLSVVADEGHPIIIELPMPPIGFALVAFAILMTLMFITMSWKGISHRH